MKKSRFFALVLLAITLGLVWWSKQSVRADDKHVVDFDKCAKECDKCAKECESCAKHCAELVAGGKKEHAKSLATCVDCGDLCALTAKIVTRKGPAVNVVCEACADFCETCAKTCQGMPEDEHMKRCAEACLNCAKACSAMVDEDEDEDGES